MQRIHREDPPLKPERCDQRLRSRNFVGLLRHLDMAQHDQVMRIEGRDNVPGSRILQATSAAAQSFAVHRDELASGERLARVLRVSAYRLLQFVFIKLNESPRVPWRPVGLSQAAVVAG